MAGAAAAAVRGTIDDNPWAGVDPLLDEEDPRRKRHRSRLGAGQGDGAASDNDERPKGTILEEGFLLQTLDVVIQILLCLDACVGVFCVVFGLVLHKKHPESLYAILWIMILGFMALKRALSVAMGLFIPTDSLWSCRRAGLTAAGYFSLLLAILEGLSAILGLCFSKNVQHYMSAEKLNLTPHQVGILVKHYSILMIALTVLAILDGVKWQLYIIYRRSIIFLEEEEERMTEAQLIRREAATGRPWWWANSTSRHGRGRRHNRNVSIDSALTDPLLDGEHNGANGRGRGGHGRSRMRTRLFLWPFGTRQTETDARDDGSVDFASVQEEWASRAEEDPVWWSREENGDADERHTESQAADTSWAHDPTDV